MWDLPHYLSTNLKRVEEFKRCIKELGFKGALIMGHPKNGFLDQDQYDDLFATAEALNVPITYILLQFKAMSTKLIIKVIIQM